MRRYAISLLSSTAVLTAGCADPNFARAVDAGKVVACVVCNSSPDAAEQARAYSDALRNIAEALAVVAARKGKEGEVRALLERLEEGQRTQREDFDLLYEIAGEGE